ncbi:hypothetical protein KY290_033661 [Solanum tuberosum]|uniref:Uncharacterized protein n=1 Tax=Solanum tuberosum TaxID=4113 RepID=A0ABQ7U2B9_SOLTU|nr:hypothetical protein KY289_033031 [Solanum tuberosum]KAH0740618.1 hypothetical protein KY290_033661 [Solanum tuberosum]
MPAGTEKSRASLEGQHGNSMKDEVKRVKHNLHFEIPGSKDEQVPIYGDYCGYEFNLQTYFI